MSGAPRRALCANEPTAGPGVHGRWSSSQFQEAFKAKQLPRALGLAHTVRELAFEAYGSKHTVFASALNNVALVHKVGREAGGTKASRVIV